MVLVLLTTMVCYVGVTLASLWGECVNSRGVDLQVSQLVRRRQLLRRPWMTFLAKRRASYIGMGACSLLLTYIALFPLLICSCVLLIVHEGLNCL